MRVVIQRISRASVSVNGETVGQIEGGMLALVGIGHDDGEHQLQWMARKIATLRIFDDDEGKMNRALSDVGGGILAVSQFTLMADVEKGRRPAFADAAPPEIAAPLFERFCALLRAEGCPVETGRFGADMQVSLVNDGPVTIVLER